MGVKKSKLIESANRLALVSEIIDRSLNDFNLEGPDANLLSNTKEKNKTAYYTVAGVTAAAPLMN